MSDDFKIQITEPEDTTEESKIDVQSHDKTMTFQVSGNYQFSPSITGKMDITNTHRLDLKKNNTFDTFSLSFQAIIKF